MVTKSSYKDVLKAIHKDHGPDIATVGAKVYKNRPRIPTGIFALDLACVVGSSLVRDASTGKQYPISEVVAKKMALAVPSVTDGSVSKGAITNWVCKGERPCLTIITRGGVETTVAEEHAFLTPTGYVRAKDLTLASRLIRPLYYPWGFPDGKISDSLVRFLGYWIADGSGYGDTTPSVSKTSADSAMLQDLHDIATSKGYTLSQCGITYTFSGAPQLVDWRGQRLQTNIFKGFLIDMGVWGVPPDALFVPDFVFGLRKHQVALFLASLWAGDGTVHPSKKSASYHTVSRILAEQVKFLLSRFGVHSYIYVTPAAERVMPNGDVSSCLPGYMVCVTGDTNLRAMAESLPLIGHKGDRLREHASKELSNREAYAIRNKCGRDVYADEVISIEPAGIQTVYDVTVEPHHNLIIDDVVGHNTGGGFPEGKVSIVWGAESSSKTNCTLLAIRQAQLKYPNKVAVFVDAEHALDLSWAAQLGVDVDRLVLLQPEYAEQAVDFIESFMHTDDTSIIVLDSIAALTTQNELKNSAETAVVGGAGLALGKLFRKAAVAYTAMDNAGVMGPAFIAINQMRNKVGFVMGDPSIMPGGFAPKHASAMTMRFYGKNEMDKTLSKAVPAFKDVTATITKWKCPILATTAVFRMQMIEAGGNKPGFVSDWNTVSAYMKELDYLTKDPKKGWLMGGKHYQTLEACRDVLYSDPVALADMRDTLIKELLAKGAGYEGVGEMPAEETGT